MKMKGFGDDIPFAFGVILYGIVILLFWWFLSNLYVDYQGQLRTPQDARMSIEFAHSFRHCIEERGGGEIKADFLNKNKGKPIYEICGFGRLPDIKIPFTGTAVTYRDFRASITDVDEEGKSWNFDPPLDEKDAKHSIWIDIIYGSGEKHVGRLYVG